MNLQLRKELDSFFVKKVTLEKVLVSGAKIDITYRVDEFKNSLSFEYDTISFEDEVLKDKNAAFTFAVSLAICGLARFGTILPEVMDISKYSAWIPPQLFFFFKKTIPFIWSEQRYQVDRLDYYGPELVIDYEALGSKVKLPIWGVESTETKVIAASGGGKDGLLCARLLEEAGVKFDIVSYLCDLYGDVDEQDVMFNRVMTALDYDQKHNIKIFDDFVPWLEQRMANFRVINILKAHDFYKFFRVEGGEAFIGSLSIVPIQIKYKLSYQIFGNEKSGDSPNIMDEETGEQIAHQYAKSFLSERAVFNLYSKLFDNVNKISLIKPIYDVKIFKTLFPIAGDLVYETNSCNIEKPWCGKCHKCSYVFLGFSAFGDFQKTKAMFGSNPLEDEALVPIYEDLLGFKGHIPWECVGGRDETAVYFYKLHSQGVEGVAMEMFKNKILNKLENPKTYFDNLEKEYSAIHASHHHMPEWLWKKIHGVLASY